MFNTLKVKITDLKYDWQHSPKKQRSSLIAIAIIIIALVCLWFALGEIERNTLGTKGGNVFAPPATEQVAPEQKSEAPSEEKPNDTGTQSKPSTPESTNGKTDATSPDVDLSIMAVQNHAASGVKLDKLPRVAAPYASRCEETLQSLLSASFEKATNTKAYLDEHAGIEVVSGEGDKVMFTVQVTSNDKQLVQVDLSYNLSSKAFGIVNALTPAMPPAKEAKE